MTILLTDDQLTKLHAESARLTDEAERLLEAAEASDDPDDWDAWKEADGIAAGHALALQAIAATGCQRRSKIRPCGGVKVDHLWRAHEAFGRA